MDKTDVMPEIKHADLSAMADYFNIAAAQPFTGTEAHLVNGVAIITHDGEEKVRMPESVYRLLRSEEEAKRRGASGTHVVTKREEQVPRNRAERRSRAAKRRRK